MLRQDQLFLALTRPALTWGVPFEALVINVLICFSAGVFLRAPTFWRAPFWFWLAFIPIHLALRELTAWDYHWFRTLRLEAQTLVIVVLEILPTTLPRSAQTVPSCV